MIKTIRETSTVNKSMNRACTDCISGLNEVISYHRRQLTILYENRCIGYGDTKNKIFSRPVLLLRRKMLMSILDAILEHGNDIKDEIIEIDESLEKDIFSDDEAIIYDQRDRTLPTTQKWR